MNLYQKWCITKATVKLERLEKFYNRSETILDVGSGNCALSLLLKNNNMKVTSLDIANKSAYKEITPVIFDGLKLPYGDNEFDVVQLITVLHHIKQPEIILKEAIRVGKKIIVMEDVYESTLQKYLTFWADSINNWEFIGHPHSNKTDEEWRQLFKKYNIELTQSEYYKFLLFFKQVTYVLVK